jgi:hypothetical protein
LSVIEDGQKADRVCSLFRVLVRVFGRAGVVRMMMQRRRAQKEKDAKNGVSGLLGGKDDEDEDDEDENDLD